MFFTDTYRSVLHEKHKGYSALPRLNSAICDAETPLIRPIP